MDDEAEGGRMIEVYRIPAGTKIRRNPDTGKWHPVDDDDPRATHTIDREVVWIDGAFQGYGWSATSLRNRPPPRDPNTGLPVRPFIK